MHNFRVDGKKKQNYFKEMCNNFTKEIIKDLLQIEGCINFSSEYEFEVKPGKYSPVYVNMKLSLSNSSLRKRIVDEMSRQVSSDTTYVCGIESGGSYYASAIADKIGAEFLLYRTKSKSYGVKSPVVGKTPVKGSKLMLIDDVLATGTTMSSSARYFREFGVDVNIMSVFSYGFDQEISDKYKLEVDSLIKFNDLFEVAKKDQKVDYLQEEAILQYLKTYLDLI